MSAYNPDETKSDKETKERSGSCGAHGCPLTGSINIMSQGWFCVYHSTQDRSILNEITEMLVKHSRVWKIIKAVDSITSDDFNKTQASDSWKLSENIKPFKGEHHKHWVFRVKDLIHQELKARVMKIMHRPQTSFEGMPKKNNQSDWAVHELTSGSLLKGKQGVL